MVGVVCGGTSCRMLEAISSCRMKSFVLMMIRWCVVLMVVISLLLISLLISPPSSVDSSDSLPTQSPDKPSHSISRSTTQGHRDLVERTKDEEVSMRLICC